MNQLYLVRADTEDGVNADLFVRANSVQEATAMWQAYCLTEAWDVPTLPLWLGAIPDQPTHGPIPWAELETTYP